jgi:tetratricopeptide (TPR) repeat protein
MALDRLRLYGDSLALLEAAAVAGATPATRPAETPPGGVDARAWVRRALAQRQWQLGRYQAVADSLAAIDAKTPAADAHLLAYRALSLDALGRGGEAMPIVEALARREDDPTAAAWAKAIRAREAEPALPPAERVKAYQAALEDDADVAAIHYLLGEAYGAEGETELAVAAWRKAAELSPSWALPASMAARA